MAKRSPSKKAARPGARCKLTRERQRAICDAITVGCTYKLAAQAAGICERTLYNWLEKGEAGEAPIYVQFLQDVKRAEGAQAAQLLQLIATHAANHWQAAAWMLERRHGYASPQALAAIEKGRQEQGPSDDQDVGADVRAAIAQVRAAGGVDAALQGEQ